MGDYFLRDTIDSFEEWKHTAKHDKNVAPPYMIEFFNVEGAYQANTSGVKHAMTRALNGLLSEINKTIPLPTQISGGNHGQRHFI